MTIEDSIVKNLHDIPYLSEFSVQDLARISPYVEEQIIKKGEIIFKQDALADKLFFISEGEVEISSDILAKTIKSGFFGEESVLAQPNYFYQAKATKACKIFIFKAKDLNKILEKYAALRHSFSLSLLRFGLDNRDVVNIVPSTEDENADTKGEVKKFIGWILAFIIPIVLYNLPMMESLPANTKTFLAIFGTTINMWVFKLVPDYIAGLLPIIVVLTLGITPNSIILSGFQSSSFFMAMSIFVLSAIVVQSGLVYRVLLNLLKHLPPIKFVYNIMLTMIGMILTSIIPSTNGRVGLVFPLLIDIINILDFKKKGKEANRLAISTFFGISLFSAIFMTSKSINFVLFGMLSAQVQDGFQWLDWALAASVAASVSFVIFMFISTQIYRSDEQPQFKRSDIEKQLTILGPISNIEWSIIFGIVLLMLGIITASAHKIKPAWVALAIMFVFLAWNTLDKKAFKDKIDWPFLFLLGTLIGLAKAISFLQIDDIIASQLGGLIELMKYNFYLFVLALAFIIFIIRFAVSINATVVIVASIFLPLSESAGINAWVMGFMILTLSEAFLVPYQCSYYIMFKSFNEKYDIYDESSFLKFNILGSLIRIIAIYASIPLWQAMEILQ